MDTANTTPKAATRKRRSDRTHIVYMLVVKGQQYIGITAKTETTVLKSVITRMNKHWYRAQKENKDWLLCQALRSLQDRSEIETRVLAIVRGKAEGHKEEVKWRRELSPALNTDVRGD